MSKVGEIKHGREIGKDSKSDRYRQFIWYQCPKCKKHNWRRLEVAKKIGINTLCQQCCARIARIKNWKSTSLINRWGYVQIRIAPDNPFFLMAIKQKRGYGRYVLEHRLVMAQYLRRCLTQDEIVHHLNGIKTDNRKENLVVIDIHNHKHNTLTELLRRRIRELEQLRLNI